ncbi:hypothetical protein D9757_003833 [Collybiopsis confluens]|uniref:C2H2-type domain-containing protein n=1 Tax=Collybiopsis confluens TaxID=2823264 RepID=A0A8H5HV02_9AGAR|nr:hypothetical protein D9757_003833 [Collybiopsis confluens]
MTLFKCSVCKKEFQLHSSLMKHRNLSKKCKREVKFITDNGGRLPKLRKLSEDRDIADANASICLIHYSNRIEFYFLQMRLDHSPSPPPAPLPAAQIVPPAPIAESARIALKPSRSGRTRYLPARFQDNLPTLSRTMPGTFQPEEEIEDPPPPAQSPAPTPPLSPEPEPVFTEVRTKPDRFGLFQIYSELPEFIPDEEVPIEDVCEGAGFPVSPPADTTSIFSSVIKPLKENIIAPFLNITVWRLMAWWYSSETKSIADLDRLVKEVIRPDEFEPSHLEDFSTKKVLRTVRDKITRIKLERVDSDFRRSSVERARRIIFEKGYSVSSKAVENLLGDYSWTSTRNTFSTLFYEFGFNFYNIIVSDVLHEIELGVWKAVLTHLIRILTSVGSLSLEEMNQRFRRIPTFGRDTIRKINKNVSLMQNLAARDYEDFLQVSLPVFEGLFGTHNKNVQHLLFDLNAVHSFAKLRLHSDPTLDVLDRHTSQLGKSLRVFKNHVCPAFSTKELAKEAGARQRRQAKDQQKRGSTLRSKKAAQTPNKKVFSLSTYKIHALGSYARFIRMFGTTDSYSTQVGELEHRRIKRFYSRTNKVFRYVRQVTGHERRVRIIQSIKQRLEDRNSTAPRVPFQHKDPLLVTDPRTHYHISMDRSRWTEEHEHDLSVKHFLRKLKIHLFCRLTTQNDSGDISLEDRSQVIIDSNRMYLHKVLRINYTSYDLRRCQDSINARTHSDIMVLSPDSDDDEHPYLYARVIGIYHVNASLQDEPLKQMDFLWVRWYAMEDNQSCWKTKRLPEVGFIDSTDDQAFGFIDPAHVIRAVHLLPNFDVGQVSDILGPSIARRSDEEDQDYSRYYVNIFADRDMVIRFCPDLTLGAHIATSIPMEYASSDVESEEEVDEEELGEEEDDEDEIEIASRAGSADSDQDSVESDKYVDGEWSDFGYDNGDSSNDEEQENERDAIDGSNIGPEDGEEPFNHDVEVLDTEGYAVL